MKRDINLLRELLIFAETNGKSVVGTAIYSDDLELIQSRDQLHGHINLLVDAGFMKNPGHTQSTLYLGDLTTAGYDFLDSVRDPKIWKKTKAVGEKAGGWTIDILSEIAKGLIKTKIKKHTGVEI